MTNPDPHISRKITHLYILALLGVAFLSIGGQILVQKSLNRQLSDSRVINMAGRQRMLSQRICKTVLLLQTPGTDRTAYLGELRSTLALWRKHHLGLQKGYLAEIDTRVNNSDSIRAMFRQVNPHFNAIYQQASYLSQAATPTQLPPAREMTARTRILLQHESTFLEGMDRIVFQYDAEANLRVNRSGHMERILLFCTLAILAMEALFIFQPMVNYIRQTFASLSASEQKANTTSQELTWLNQSLEEARGALLRATNQRHQQELHEQKLRLAYLVEGQEEERKRLSREIHDGLGQMLTALKFGLEKLPDNLNDPEKAAIRVNDLQQLAGQIVAEARTMSFNLMPAALTDFGLTSALKLLASLTSSQTGTPITFSATGISERLPVNIETGLYRVCQEALNNALKYAGAREIRITLRRKKKSINLEVLDNGQGFSPEPASPDRVNQGLTHMRERVFLLNGEMTISSEPGKGTHLRVKIPMTDGKPS